MGDFSVVGLPDIAVKESRERIKSGLKNCGFDFPNPRSVTINLAPADIRKEGPGFDLPMALGILGCQGTFFGKPLNGQLFLGELSLDGSVRPVRGTLSAALCAREQAIRRTNATARYVSKISGPLLDRIDIHIDVPAVKYKELRGEAATEDSAAVRERVVRARRRQLERFALKSASRRTPRCRRN